MKNKHSISGVPDKQINDPDHNLTKWQKIIYTGVHFYIHLNYGMTVSSMAPALVDFKHLMNTRMEWIGLWPTFQCLGTLVGTCFTLLYKWLNRQITMSTFLICMAVTTILMPWSVHLWQFYLLIFIYGLGIGVWDGANNVILIEMWRQKSPSLLQLSQFMFGVGTILGPLLTKDFVIGEMLCPGVYPNQCFSNTSIELVYPNTTTNTTVWATSDQCSQDCLDYDRRIMLKVPFLIGGLTLLLGPFALLFMYVLKKYHYSSDCQLRTVLTEEQLELYKNLVPKKTIIVCISIFLAFGIMSENMYTNFSPTFFQFQPTLRLSAAKAAEISYTMSIAFAIGRGISIFAAMYLKPQHMISFQLIIVFAGYLFQILGQDQLELLWASAVIICFGYSSIFICLFSFVGQYMEVTDRIGGLFIGSYNSIYLFLPYFVSRFIETLPSSFLYLEISSLSVAIVAFIYVLISVRKVPNDVITRQLNNH